MNSPTDDKTGTEADTRELSPNSTPRVGDVIADSDRRATFAREDAEE